MNAQQYAEMLVRNSEYKILGYSVGESKMILFVDEITHSQSEIQKTFDGRSVEIVLAT